MRKIHFQIMVLALLSFCVIPVAKADLISNADIMTTLMTSFKAAIEQQQSDRDYYMARLSEMNDISNALSDTLQDLADNSGDLEGAIDEAAGDNLVIEEYLKYLVANGYPHDVFLIPNGVQLSLEDLSALNSAIQDGDFNSLPNTTPVPEPATMLLLGSGLIGLAGYGRKKFLKK
jgi:hypothetical protein